MYQTVRQRTGEWKIEGEISVGVLLVQRPQPHRNLHSSHEENNYRKITSGIKTLVLTNEKRKN